MPLDRNAKARIMVLARALSHPTEKRKHYGKLTAKFVRVLGWRRIEAGVKPWSADAQP